MANDLSYKAFAGRDSNGDMGVFARERITSGFPSITTDHGLIHEGIAYTVESYLTIGATNTGGFYFTTPPATAVAATLTTNFAATYSNVTLTAQTAGSRGNLISILYADPSATGQSLAVTASLNAITASLATDADGTIITTASQVAAAINTATDLVTATKEGVGSGVITATAVAYLAGGKNAAYIHFKAPVVRSTVAATVTLAENYTCATSDTATTVVPLNRNRNSIDTSSMTFTTCASTTPTAGTGAAVMTTGYIGANAPSYRVGGEQEQAEEWVLKPSTPYALTVYNTTTGSGFASLSAFWYEEGAY